MSASEHHKFLLASLVGTLVCHAAAKNLVVSAKFKMQNGEAIGGCTKFGGIGNYIDLHLKQDGQSYEAAERATYRLLNGVGIDSKFDSSKYRAEQKKAAEEKAAAIAERKEVKAAKKKTDAAVKATLAKKYKTDLEKMQAAFDKRETNAADKVTTEAEKQTRPLQKQLAVLESKIKDMTKVAASADCVVGDEAKALRLADTFARNVAVSISESGRVNDKKLAVAARKAAVEFCKLRGISFLTESTTVRETAEEETVRLDEELYAAHGAA
jgi:hypothetical protein